VNPFYSPLAADDRTWDIDLTGSDSFTKLLGEMRTLASRKCAEYDDEGHVWHVRTRDGAYGITAIVKFCADRGATVTETTGVDQ
jgi:hypothetical protein